VRELQAMREERRSRREKIGDARIRLDDAERSGKLVIEAKGVNYSWGALPVIRDLSTVIMRGDKVGLIGPNGCGKSTLLQLLLGTLEPDSGSVRIGTKLEVAYFDQLRAGINEDMSVQDNVGGGSDNISIQGRSKHVISYLKDFLFTPERARAPVSMLSGGERNRLLLAKLFTKPANLLVMDEPTNDLDAETLELLEELLLEYQGTLLLVSHDRDFLDNIVTSSLVFEGEGRVNDYVGGYSDWLTQRPAPVQLKSKQGKEQTKPKLKPAVPEGKNKPAKLSYKDQRELDELPKRIEALENEQEALHEQMADPSFYQQGGGDIATTKEKMEQVEADLAVAYERWEALELLLEG